MRLYERKTNTPTRPVKQGFGRSILESFKSHHFYPVLNKYTGNNFATNRLSADST